MNEERNIIGVIENKQFKSYKKKDGSGEGKICVYTISGLDMTTFNDFSMDFDIGMEVEVVYTEKQNGNFLNRNIKVIKEPSKPVTLSEETLKKIEEVKKTMQETGKNASDPEFKGELEKRKDPNGGITTAAVAGAWGKENALPCGENIINVGDKSYKVTIQELP
jgi:hypothetical protein